MTSKLPAADGFTLIDMMVVIAVISILAAISVPTMQDVSGSIAVGQARQMVESELQQARLKAVTSNRTIRVRFNCPATNQFRMVELIGTPSNPTTQDAASNRCSETAFPYPADRNPLTFPNHDGPIRHLTAKVNFGAVATIEFRPSGTAYSVNTDGSSGAPLSNTGTAITVTKGSVVKTVTVNGFGKVQGQ